MRTFHSGPLFVYEWGERDAPAVLYWDGLGGTGLHANELAPLLVERHGLRVVAPDPPGHGRSAPLTPDDYRPTALADLAAGLLAELGIGRVAFVGFSWGGRVGVWFAARFPERTAALALIEGGHYGSSIPTSLEQAIEAARGEVEEETYADWDAYFAFEREALRRWTPAVQEVHRAVMREEAGRITPIVTPETFGAIHHGSRCDPLSLAYPAIGAAEVPVLLIVADGSEEDEVARFRTALPDARVESIPDAIHDLVSFAPDELARLVGPFASASP